MDYIKMRAMSAKGIVGIFELFENFFTTSLGKMTDNKITDYKAYFQTMKEKFQKARQYSKIGKTLAIEISSILARSEKLISSVSTIQKGFGDATKGLRGASNLSDKAVTGIQSASDSIQESIDNIKNDIQNLKKSESLAQEDREALDSIYLSIDKIGDVSFNIMMELQFQDILRQQLSAVADILAKIRERIAMGLEKIAGISMELPDAEEGFAVTDESILSDDTATQDDVDALLNSTKEDGSDKSSKSG